MEMSITEAHRILSNGLINAPSEHEWCTAFKIAIETMRKYQQIEQIYKEWFSDAEYTSADAYTKIGEVLKDGDDN